MRWLVIFFLLVYNFCSAQIDPNRIKTARDSFGIPHVPRSGLPFIESINTFGASMDPSSRHFKDQIGHYQSQQLKRMSLDKEEVLKKAKSIYHPVKQN